MGEKDWVKSLTELLSAELAQLGSDSVIVTIADGTKLAYTCEIHEYPPHAASDFVTSRYETDLLISDVAKDDRWVPRVVIECKLGSVTTHDALTYSSKAATHKHVHPYLRYGILIGDREEYAIPGRLVRHGAYFDFMITWKGTTATKAEWSDTCRVLAEEVQASRALHLLLTTTRSSKRKRYSVLHRPLRLQ